MNRVTIILNPISGGRRPADVPGQAEQAAALAASRGVEARVIVTEGAGHARELAAAAAGRGESLVIAWGGDGTVNEVASALVFSAVSLGILPAGSGNGLARDLGLPTTAQAALLTALEGRCRTIDAGDVDGRFFFNVAGIGLDADVAHRFAANGLSRGFRGYVMAGMQALAAFEPVPCRVVVDDVARATRPLLVALANSRQYGSGALIAPAARLDDGLLDVVTVEYRPLGATLRRLPSLFSGRIASVPGVHCRTGRDIVIAAECPLRYHLDGEPMQGGSALHARVHPGALRVQVPDG